MGMTNVRGTLLIQAVSDGDTLTAMLIPTKPLVQEVTGTTVTSPSWKINANRPEVYPHVQSALTVGSLVTDISNAEWYWDEKKIVFPSAQFDRGTYDLGSGVPSLIIKDDIMIGKEGDKLIRGEFDVQTGGNTTRITLTREVKRQTPSTSGYSAYLDADRGGYIDLLNKTVGVRVILQKGGNVVPTSGYTVQWFKYVANDTDGTTDGIMTLGKSGNPIILRQADISLMETIFAKVLINGSVVATTDGYNIYDRTDPYLMVFEKSRERVGQGQPMTVTLKVTTADTTSPTDVTNEFPRRIFALYNGKTLAKAVQNSVGANSDKFVINYGDFKGVKELSLRAEVTK